MPYRDSFDHKGPLMYILNWLGNRIASYRGIWVIEMIFLTVTFYMLYKIARLSCGRIASVVTFFTASTLLFPYFEGGNFTDEYNFLSGPIYIDGTHNPLNILLLFDEPIVPCSM